MSELEVLHRQLDALTEELAEVRREAAEDGIDDEEQTLIDEIEAMIATTRAAISEEQRHPTGEAGPGSDPNAEEGVQDMTFEDGLEINVPDPEIADTIRFDAKRGDFINYISEWRNHCKVQVESLVSAMLESDEDGPDMPRGDLISIASTILDVAEADPRIAMAAETLNTLFDLAQNAYERSLPRQPSLREAQVQWSQSLDRISNSAIENGFPGVVSAFKRRNGIPEGDEWCLPSFQADWNALIDSCREGHGLPSANDVRRQFMTVAIRAMPDNMWDEDLTSGTAIIALDFDADRHSFSFDSGYIDDITDEVRRGLSRVTDLYGPNVTDLPVQIEFRIHSASLADFGNALICSIRRTSRTSGDTRFRLDARPGSPMSLDEQGEVFEHFNRAQAWNVATRRILN